MKDQKLKFADVVYKRPISQLNEIQIWKMYYSAQDEKTKLLAVIDLLKLGDFSAKQELIKVMLESSDGEVRSLSCRVFCCVANHFDMSVLNHFVANIIKNENETELKDFILCSQYTLSPEVLPYLLSLLNDWAETEIEEKIRVVTK